MAERKHFPKVLKVICIILSVLIILSIGGYLYLTTHTQIIVSVIQRAMYTDGAAPNSFEPLSTSGEFLRADGQYRISNLCYGTEYPNSFLDITILQPTQRLTVLRCFIFTAADSSAEVKRWEIRWR